MEKEEIIKIVKDLISAPVSATGPEDPDPGPAPVPPGAIFRSRMDVLKYIQKQGFKIQKTKLYKDCVQGRLLVEKSGEVKQKSVEMQS